MMPTLRASPWSPGPWTNLALVNAYLTVFLVVLLAGAVALLVGPYGGLLAVGFVGGLVVRPRYPAGAFAVAFVAGAALWAAGALWFGAGAGRLPDMIAELLGVGSALSLGAVVSLVGGVSAGLFALLGTYVRLSVQGVPPPRGAGSPTRA